MLIENTLYGEVDKVKVAINRLKLHEPKEGYYLAFSGGEGQLCVLRVMQDGWRKIHGPLPCNHRRPTGTYLLYKRALSGRLGKQDTS